MKAPESTCTSWTASSDRYRRLYAARRGERGKRRERPESLQKATHGVGKLRLLSGRKAPCPLIIFTPIAPAFVWLSMKWHAPRSASLVTIVSGFRSST